LKVAGEVVAESGSFKMGQELSSTTGITQLTGGWNLASNKPIVGEFYAIGIDLQGITDKQLTISRGGTLAGTLHKAALLYFHSNDSYLKLQEQAHHTIAYRQPSFGTFSTNLEVIYSFGIPKQVKGTGILIDMDVVTQSLWAKDNDIQRTQVSVRQLGMMISALEHRVPELFFTNETTTGVGVSAIKALSVALAQGQKVYQINSANVATVLPKLNVGSEVKTEIRNSVAVGKIATISKNNVTIGNWTGVGYIIADSQTGAGAYRISGGSNGGDFNFTEDAKGLVNLLIIVGLSVLSPKVADLLFDDECGEEDIVRQLALVVLLIALVILVSIFIVQQPWLAPVLVTLMSMLSKAAYAENNKKYISCPVLIRNDPNYIYTSKFAAMTAAKMKFGPSISLRPKGSIPGDPAKRGPCGIGSGYDVGEHWNIFGTEFAVLPAITMCRCCLGQVTKKRFAIK